MLNSPSLCQHDVTTFSACGDDDDGFLLNYTSVLHMREEAAEAREQGDFETRPFFNVALRPNNRKYNSTFQLAGLHGSGGFIHAESKIKLQILFPSVNLKQILVQTFHNKSAHFNELMFLPQFLGRDSYHIQANKRKTFSLIWLVVETRFVRKVVLEFFERSSDNEMKLEQIDLEKVS